MNDRMVICHPPMVARATAAQRPQKNARIPADRTTLIAVVLCIGILPVGVSSFAQPEDSKPEITRTITADEWRAVVDNEILVDLVSVSKCEDGKRTSWHPDGIPLRKMPYDAIAHDATPAEGNTRFEICAQFLGLGDRRIETEWRSDPGADVAEPRGSVPTKDGERLHDHQVWLVEFPNEVKICSIQVQFVVGGPRANDVGNRPIGEGENVSSGLIDFGPISLRAGIVDLGLHRNLVNSMVPVNELTVTRNGDGVLLEDRGDIAYLHTKRSYRPPFALKTRVKTDSTNIRLYYGDWNKEGEKAGILIFNWEGNQSELRVHYPNSDRLTPVPGKGHLSVNEWHDVVWDFEPTRMRILVDGEERFASEGDFRDVDEKLGIGPAFGSKVTVQRFEVMAR
jgi:hypothetical protein